MFYPSDRVLVAIMNNRRDFDIARDKGWYRIPTKYAPPNVPEAAVLAFYFTRAFDAEKWTIRWYAPIRGHELARRSDLFPDESDHPRADETYYKIQIGPLAELEQPIPSLRWRRITISPIRRSRPPMPRCGARATSPTPTSPAPTCRRISSPAITGSRATGY